MFISDHPKAIATWIKTQVKDTKHFNGIWHNELKTRRWTLISMCFFPYIFSMNILTYSSSMAVCYVIDKIVSYLVYNYFLFM